MRFLILACHILAPHAACAATLAPFGTPRPLRDATSHFADDVFALSWLGAAELPLAVTECGPDILALAHVVLLMIYAIAVVAALPGLGQRIARRRG